MEFEKMTFASQLKYAVTDTWQIVLRNIRRNFRLPELLVFSSIQPIIFLLLFNYVFGGAVTGDDYINFLLPGILAQTVLFGAIQTGVGLAEDMQKGVVDRFRSLPMSRVSHLLGRILADALRNLIVVVLLFGVGHLIGFRFTNGWGLAGAGIVLASLFGIAFSWIAAMFGLLTRDSETAQVFGFLWTFPMVFASSVFVQTTTMPGWLQAFANNQPVTHAVNAMRYLMHGDDPFKGGDASAIWKIGLWCIGIIIVIAPIAVTRYRKAA